MTPTLPRSFRRWVPLALLLALAARPARAADPTPGPPLTIHRAAGAITPDGDLSDPGWQGVEGITTWFETNPGDNVEPKVRNVAYLAYDERYLYAAFRLEDPQPGAIRAPLGDHDAVPSSTDYAGLIVDSRNDGKTAQMFLANPNGVQYDALTSDVTGEDSSPDFYWDAAGRIGPEGWTLEIRIPFSSLRYAGDAQPTWGLLLYRNYPRDRRYQFFSARLPKDVSCFVCNSSKLTGLTDLPHGSHLVAAPFTTASQADAPRNGTLGNPLERGDFESDAGVDVKWNPLANAAIDVTYRPDFSQVEADAAQISANERFALSYPEKRSFFLEGADLFATPFQAVYTRTITSPSGGVRATGRFGASSYTALVTRDRGGGRVTLPGPQGSGDAPQDFRSDVGVVRMRRDLGQSFVSALVTAREIEGDAYNRVFGPDFQWRPNPSDAITGQALWSDTRTLDRPTLAAEWDGRRLQDDAQVLSWQHGTRHIDWYLQGQNLGPDFRADDGFIPQVGYREGYAEFGYTLRPQHSFLSRIRLFSINWHDAEPDGGLLGRRFCVGAGMDGRLNSFIRIELNREDYRVGDALLERFRPRLHVEASPGRILNFFSVDAYILDEIDFANGREGSGTTVTSTVTVRPTDHLELRGDVNGRWLDVTAENGDSGQLLSVGIQRLRATYSFSSRAFVRLIGQHELTRRNTGLYTFTVRPKVETLTSSALLAYKLNWQTVMFLCYGDGREFVLATDQLERSGRQMFAKLSYAWQQ